MYLYVPGAMNRSDALWPSPKLSVCPSPVRKTMLCWALSRFVQVTVSPAVMNSTSGRNAKPEISTLCVAADALVASAKNKRAHANTPKRAALIRTHVRYRRARRLAAVRRARRRGGATRRNAHIRADGGLRAACQRAHRTQYVREPHRDHRAAGHRPQALPRLVHRARRAALDRPRTRDRRGQRRGFSGPRAAHRVTHHPIDAGRVGGEEGPFPRGRVRASRTD